MAKLLKVAGKSNRKPRKYVKKNDALSDQFETIQGPIDTQHLLISTLLPPAVKMFIQELEKEVDQLCGRRYRHSDDQNYRWGSQKGSIILGNQHVAIEKPRVRSAGSGKEIRLQTYEDFQDPKIFESKVFAEGLKKVSQRDYEKGLSTIAGSFGF